MNKQTAVGPSVGSSFGDLRLPVVRGKRATPAWFRQTYDYIVGSIGDDSFKAKFARQINDLLEKRRVEFERAEAVFIWLRISEPDDGLMSLIGDDNEVDEYLAAVETLAWLFHRQITDDVLDPSAKQAAYRKVLKAAPISDRGVSNLTTNVPFYVAWASVLWSGKNRPDLGEMAALEAAARDFVIAVSEATQCITSRRVAKSVAGTG